ncbi:MAG: hypothetical protein KJZ70_00835 [Bryobacterales bacterium]|nr:hypothetical protein [Bryobacterales bacterium]
MDRRAFLLTTASGAASAELLVSCAGRKAKDAVREGAAVVAEGVDIRAKLAQYVTVKLEGDAATLAPKDKQVLRLLVDVAKTMDDLFWRQAWGDKDALLASAASKDLRRYLEINYGPWDRLDDNKPFVEGAGAKPPGANFYPREMTKAEFERQAAGASAAEAAALKSAYTVIQRDGDKLKTVPYSRQYGDLLWPAAARMREAAKLAADAGFANYLNLRALALETDNYQPSDLAWLDMKTNTIDFVVGPIETYEDALFGYKTAFEAYVLIKDKAWSERLTRYAAMLPDLQRNLPVPDAYKRETPGSDSDLNAYDVVYYAGDCNAGAKTIAINLPNDEEVQLKKGTRRLQLKNAMRAKFERILAPIANQLIAKDQRKHVTFDAFFANTMFHEVAHGLGVKNTINGRGSVREALKELASALEEGKADILGLYMVSELQKRGELGDADLMDYYTTFLAGIFRSVRFGAASAHGVANTLRFNFFAKMGAFSVDPATKTYRVTPGKMSEAVAALSEKILRLQGDGDYAGTLRFVDEMGRIPPDLEADLARVNAAGIPVDVVFEQGVDWLS